MRTQSEASKAYWRTVPKAKRSERMRALAKKRMAKLSKKAKRLIAMRMVRARAK